MPPFFVCVCVCVCIIAYRYLMNMLSNLIRMILKKKKVRPWACSLKRELELECVMLHKKKED